jgi:hypothetical protein
MQDAFDPVHHIRALQREGAHAQAIALAGRTLAKCTLAPGHRGTDKAATLHYLKALSLDAQGRAAEAAPHYARAIDRVIELFLAEAEATAA